MTLHYGRSDQGKIVIMVMSDDNRTILHRISMTQEEWDEVKVNADQMQLSQSKTISNHEQVN